MLTSFTSPLPPTLNQMLRDINRSGANRIKRQWTQDIAILCHGLPQFTDQVWMSFAWQLKNFGRDPDNTSAACKFILDGMVLAGVIPGDNLNIIQSPFIHWFEHGKDEVTVTVSDSPIFTIAKFTETVC